MMMRVWMLGIVLFLLAVVVQTPAAWLAPRVARATHQSWRLGDAEGTLWHGRATIYDLDRDSGRWHAGRRLHWRLIWSQLLHGRLEVRAALDGGGGVLLAVGTRYWSIEQLRATFPADQIAALLPGTLAEYGWSGSMHATAKRFRCQWKRRECSGKIELKWDHAGVALVPGPPFGDYRVQLIAEGPALRFDLRTVRGRLQVTGSGEIDARMLRFNGQAAARGEGSASLRTILSALGRPGAAPGSYLIDYREALK